MNLQGKNLDTALRMDDHQPVEALLMRDDGYGLRYSVDKELFRHWVLYTKGEADQFLCIEPLTWLPDAPNLQHDASFTGMVTLEPGQTLVLGSSLQMIYPGQ
jgi:aldose 1-epimerase